MQLLSLLIATVVTAFFCLPQVRRFATPWENRLRAAMRRPVGGWMAAGLLSLVVNFAVTMRAGIPQPRVHDEFSYLLAADTFAHGRLTNPTHSLWPFFVTFHELQHPSYMSKYPPAQGLLLAIGQVLDRLPILGAWIGAAVLCIAAGWALAAFVPAVWSVIGALMLAVHPLIVQWSQTYWGGTAAAIGGALVLGAVGRVGWMRGNAIRVGAGIALGIGIGVLAASRPYEGAAFAIAAILPLVIRPRPKTILIAALAAAPIFGWLGYYNYRVTGSALQLPYLLYERQYAVAPPLLLQSPRTPTDLAGAPIEMRQYADAVEMPHYLAQRNVRGYLSIVWQKMRSLALAVAAPWIVALAVLGILLAVAADRRLWLPLLAVAATLAATAASNWTRSQYVAPAAVAVLVLLVAGLREITDRFAPAGRGLVIGIFVGSILISWQTATVPASQQFQRSILLASLQQLGGKHLVLVRYLPDHLLDDEWVFNDADIDASAVVFAHDFGWQADRKVIDYFSGRDLWRLDVSADNATLTHIDPLTGNAIR